MVRVRSFALFVLIFLAGCAMGSSEHMAMASNSKFDIDQLDQAGSSTDRINFEGQMRGASVRLTITQTSPTEIFFQLRSSKDSSIKIEGRAVLRSGVDPEVDEDEAGTAYPVDEYIYEDKSCRLAIRVDSESRTRLIIIPSDSGAICAISGGAHVYRLQRRTAPGSLPDRP